LDFITTASPPVTVNIDGTRYQAPRFRLSDFKAWASVRIKETLDAALAYLPDPEHKARFRLYFAEPLFDVAAVADELRTAQGVAFVLQTCLSKAGVPGETIEKLIDNADPLALRALAGQIASVDKAVVTLQEQSGDGGKAETLRPQRQPLPTLRLRLGPRRSPIQSRRRRR
jgi:hypothetical protein